MVPLPGDVELLDQLAGSQAMVVVGMSLQRLSSVSSTTVDATRGISDGESAADRARTMRVVATSARAEDLASPGHVQAVQAEADGCYGAVLALARASGHREAVAVALVVDEEGVPVAPEHARDDPRRAHMLPVLTPQCFKAAAGRCREDSVGGRS